MAEPTQEQLLLEAERRGILPPDKQQLLNEARKRGIIKGPVAASMPEDAPPEMVEFTDKFVDSPALDGGVSDSMSWSDVGSQAIDNAWPSTKQLASDFVTPFMEPVQTAKTLGSLGLGIIQKLIPGRQADEATAEAVGKFFVDRYGGLENIKRTIAKDPAGALADLSTVLTTGGASVARVPGVVGKVGRGASRVGSLSDPINVAARAGGKLASSALGMSTGVGGEAVRAAYQSGKAGGNIGQAFRDAIRGKVPIDNVVNDAKAALEKMRMERAASYRAGMDKVGKVSRPIDFGPIEDAIKGVRGVGEYKGKDINPKASGVWGEITEAVDDWKALDPSEYHTPEGIDALKRKIGNIRDATDYGKPDRVVADAVYNAIREQIVKQAPDYAKVMSDYEEASRLIEEIGSTFSMKSDRAGLDTQIRKLQSVMRNNVNTNYGRRTRLAETLNEKKPTIIPELSGHAMNQLTPRGLQQLTMGGTVLGGMSGSPLLYGAVPFMSPRAVGEAAHAAGRARGLLGDVPVVNPEVTRMGLLDVYQAGRIQNQENR